jgi:hypothetical protein
MTLVDEPIEQWGEDHDAADATKLGKVSAAQVKQVLGGIGRELGLK